MRFRDALKKAKAWMDEIEGVEGVAEGKYGDARCITVFVSTSELPEKIPDYLGEYKVVVEQSGHFLAQGLPES